MITCDLCLGDLDPDQALTVSDNNGYTWIVCSACKTRIETMHPSYIARKPAKEVKK